jgi:hypothetical protein
MDHWVTDLEKFATDHQALIAMIVGAAALLGFTLCGAVKGFFGGIRPAALSLWSRRPQRRNNQIQASRADLRFVPIGNRPFMGDIQGENGNRNVEIFSSWAVTNNSQSGVTVRLLTAGLAKPPFNESIVHSLLLVQRVRGNSSATSAIAQEKLDTWT